MKLRKRERHELESYDEYARVVVYLDDRTRVIECRDGVQWIVQRAKLVKGQRTWIGVWFCWTKEALLRGTGPNAILEALPDRFPEATGTMVCAVTAEITAADSVPVAGSAVLPAVAC